MKTNTQIDPMTGKSRSKLQQRISFFTPVDAARHARISNASMRELYVPPPPYRGQVARTIKRG